MGKEWRRPCGAVGAMSRFAGHQSFSLSTGFGGLLRAEIETRRFSLSASTVVKGAQHGEEKCREALQMRVEGGV